jgi:hypothetical protein
MKRAARHKTGSVVFDKRRKTWNFLWWEEGKRRSKQIGTLAEYPTKGSAWRAAQLFNTTMETPKSVAVSIPTVNLIAERYCTERMPSRYSTARVYRSWLNNYILPQWGDEAISEVCRALAEAIAVGSEEQVAHSEPDAYTSRLRNVGGRARSFSKPN